MFLQILFLKVVVLNDLRMFFCDNQNYTNGTAACSFVTLKEMFPFSWVVLFVLVSLPNFNWPTKRE